MGEVGHMEEFQARLLASYLASVRKDWDAAGILAALGRARLMGDCFDLTFAAVRAATDERNRTPAVIAMQGPHWAHVAGRAKPRGRETPGRDETCATCYETRSVCAAKWGHDHTFESVAQAKARAIQAAERRRTSPPTHYQGRPIEDVNLP